METSNNQSIDPQSQDSIWRMALEAVSLGVWIHDLDSGNVEFNDALLKWLGIETTAADDESHRPPISWAERIHTDDRANIASRYRAFCDGTAPIFSEAFRLRNGDGVWQWVRARGTIAMRDATNRPTRILLSLTDLSPIYELKAELEQSRQRYALATAGGQVGVWEWTAATGELYVDSNLKQMLGYGDHELTGGLADWAPLMHPDEIDKVRRNARQCIEGRQPFYRMEHRFFHKDGSIRWIVFRGTLFQDESGQGLKLMGACTDVTDLKAAERERRLNDARLRHAQKIDSLNRMAGGVANDFNNLLMSILGNAELALQELPDASPLRVLIGDIESATLRAAELSGAMLSYSGQGLTAVQTIRLPAIVDEVVQQFKRSLSPRIQLVYTPNPDLPAVQANESEIKQILTDLLANAREAIGEGEGRVEIAANAERLTREFLSTTFVDDGLPTGRYVCIRVRDTGRGIDSTIMDRIFDPFFTTKFSGRGLGLASVLGVTRSHHGAVRVESAPDKGSCFFVYLPAPETPEAPPATRERDTEPSQRLSKTDAIPMVLVVDDEESVRSITVRMLENDGIQMLTAPDGPEGLEQFQRHTNQIALVILDMMMPKMNGAKVFRKIRAIRPDVPILVATGFSERDVLKELELETAFALIIKPYRRRELLARIQDLRPDLPLPTESR